MALNCILYANLMLSAWARRNAQARPFDADAKATGATYYLASDRQSYPCFDLSTLSMSRKFWGMVSATQRRSNVCSDGSENRKPYNATGQV